MPSVESTPRNLARLKLCNAKERFHYVERSNSQSSGHVRSHSGRSPGQMLPLGHGLDGVVEADEEAHSVGVPVAEPDLADRLRLGEDQVEDGGAGGGGLAVIWDTGLGIGILL